MREISLHLLDILNNSISAGAKRISVRIEMDTASDLLMIQVMDNGKGMSEDMLSRVTDPFSTTRTTRKVGLGLSLLEEACEICGGHLIVASAPEVGTTVTATFGISSIDRIPLGTVGETMSGVICSYPDLDFSCVLTNLSGDEFILDTIDLRKRLGNVPLSEPDVYVFIREYIAEQQEHILGGI